MPFLKLEKEMTLPLVDLLQEKFGMQEGDYIDVVVVAEGIFLRPVIDIDAEKPRARQRILDAIESVKDLQPDPSQTPEEQEAEVFQMVKDFRNHRE
jgi:hypothetical protein